MTTITEAISKVKMKNEVGKIRIDSENSSCQIFNRRGEKLSPYIGVRFNILSNIYWTGQDG